MAIPGVAPGLVSQYIGYEFESFTIVFMIFAIFFVSLRFFARYLTHLGLALDDLFMIPAIVCYIGQCATGLCMSLEICLPLYSCS